MFDLQDYLQSTKEVWANYLPWTDYSGAVAIAVIAITVLVLFAMVFKYKIEPRTAAIGVLVTAVLAFGAAFSISTVGNQKAEEEIQVLTEHTAQDLREWAAERYKVILSEEQAENIALAAEDNARFGEPEMSGVILTGSDQPVQWVILEGNKLLLTEPSSPLKELPVVSETVEISHEEHNHSHKGHDHDHSHSHDEDSHTTQTTATKTLVSY